MLLSLLSDCFSFFPSGSKSCKQPRCEILCDDVIDGRYQVVVVRHSRHKCLEVVVVSKETGNEAPRLYLSSKKTIQFLTKISKDVKWQAMTYGIRKLITDWLLVDFILSRLTIEEYGRKRVFFADILLHIDGINGNQATSEMHSQQQVLPLQSSPLSINKPSRLCPFDFKLHCLQKDSCKGNSLFPFRTAGRSRVVASQRWRWAIRRVLFNNLKIKIIHRLLLLSSSSSSALLLSSSLRSQEALFSGRSFCTCDSNTIVDSPIKIKPTNSSSHQRRKSNNSMHSTNSSSTHTTCSSSDEMFFSASRFRHLF